MSGIADYLTRRADLLLYRADRHSIEGGDLAATYEGSWWMVTGVQKVAQLFLKRVLTPIGSVPFYPDEGTILIRHARSGAWRTSADVAQSYALAASQARRQLRTMFRDDDPDDEILESDELTGVSIVAGRVALSIAITTLAGTSRTYIVPIEVAVR